MDDPKTVVRTAKIDWAEAYRARHPYNPASEMRMVPLGDAADYEMLGVCQVMLGDEASASETFKAGLAIERRRDPQSKLCGTLMKRVSMV